MQLSKGITLPVAAVLLLLQIANATSRPAAGCYASIGGVGGNIYQFDGGVVSLNAARCRVLLTRSKMRFCSLSIYAQFGCRNKKMEKKGLSRLQSLTIIVGGKRFELGSKRQLRVNGRPANVPYSAKSIRIFRRGDDLVFVHKKCSLWATFDGKFTATYRLSSSWRRRVYGMAGNCDGRKGNDPRSIVKRFASQCRVVSRKYLTKCSKYDYRAARKQCSRIIRRTRKCRDAAVLYSCIRNFCLTGRFPHMQKRVLCANFYLHSRRCARHYRPVVWRVRAGCPAKCGSNEHFSSKMNACPKTCENHFFQSPRRCFKLAPSEGCKCNRGYVLDGSVCVRPRNCVCLAKLCIDRAGNRKCRVWRQQGRCNKFPQFMATSCRLTCGLCSPRCKNQVSNQLCQAYRKRGFCKRSFYRAMCKATCNPAGCGCPPRRIYKSRCSRRYKNIVIVSKRWWPNSSGNCQRSIVVRYRPCGSCRPINKTIRGKCNYCTKSRTNIRISQYRERSGKRRCIRRVRRVARRCICRRRAQISYQCLRNVRSVRITRFWKIARGCRACVRARLVKTLHVLRRCRGTFTRGRCNKKLRNTTILTYKRVPRNCKCISQLVRRRRVACRCRAPAYRRLCSGNRWLIIKRYWILRNGRCHRRQSRRFGRIACKRRYRSGVLCRKCRATRVVRYYGLNGCKCKLVVKRSKLGVCCCPKPRRRVVIVTRYYRRIEIITYKRVGYSCRRHVQVKKILIRCPKGGRVWKCNRKNGVRTFKRWYYKRINHKCIYRAEHKRVQTKCRRPIIRIPGKCSIRRGYSKYRMTTMKFWVRRGCSCVRRSRRVREKCGCVQKKFPIRTKCPRGCSGKKCNSRCNRYVIYYKIVARGNRCKREVYLRHRFRCCCRHRQSVRNSCSRNRYLIRKVCYTVLRKGKCQRLCKQSRRRVKCRTGTFVKFRKHKNSNYRYKIILYYFIRNCKCRVKVTQRLCRTRCRRPKIRKFCDKVKRRYVSRKYTWKLVGCKKCVRSVSERSTPVRCRTQTVRRHRCLRSGVLLIKYTKYYQTGCRCRRRSWVVRKRCRCRNPITGARRCIRNRFVRQVKYWILRKGACHRRSRNVVRRVTCSRKVVYRYVCIKKSGIRIKYRGYLRSKKCRCVRIWKRVSKSRCNCRALNNSVRNKVTRRCRRNRKITIRYYYQLRRGRCIMKTRESSRGFRCKPSFTRRHRCNVKSRKQLFVKHTFVKRNCRCKLIRKNIYRRCGCSSKIIHKRQCIRASGIIKRFFYSKVWSHRSNRCEGRVRSSSYRVRCSQKIRYSNSKCISNKYYIRRKVYYVRNGCKCLRRIKKYRRNCHCRNSTHRGKCPTRGYHLKEITKVRRWNMKRRRCVIVRYRTRNIRCRCRRGYTKRRCSNGFIVREKVYFRLHSGRCYRKSHIRRYQVACNRRIHT